jgi:hypothetical protein
MQRLFAQWVCISNLWCTMRTHGRGLGCRAGEVGWGLAGVADTTTIPTAVALNHCFQALGRGHPSLTTPTAHAPHYSYLAASCIRCHRAGWLPEPAQALQGGPGRGGGATGTNTVHTFMHFGFTECPSSQSQIDPGAGHHLEGIFHKACVRVKGGGGGRCVGACLPPTPVHTPGTALHHAQWGPEAFMPLLSVTVAWRTR